MTAEMTVGNAQGTRTAALTRPLPLKARFIASAMPSPDEELQSHAGDREDQGVREPLQEVGILEHLDVVLESDERSRDGDGRLAQAQVYGLQYGEKGHDEDDEQGR
jgi:hypothetical protein